MNNDGCACVYRMRSASQGQKGGSCVWATGVCFPGIHYGGTIGKHTGIFQVRSNTEHSSMAQLTTALWAPTGSSTVLTSETPNPPPNLRSPSSYREKKISKMHFDEVQHKFQICKSWRKKIFLGDLVPILDVFTHPSSHLRSLEDLRSMVQQRRHEKYEYAPPRPAPPRPAPPRPPNPWQNRNKIP